MAIGGIGSYSASFYRTMYTAGTNKNIISGMSTSVSSKSDPMSALYSTLKDSALFKTKGYQSLVKTYYSQQAENMKEEANAAADSFKDDSEQAVQKAKETLSNITYNASGVTFAENSVSSGSLLNMQI